MNRLCPQFDFKRVFFASGCFGSTTASSSALGRIMQRHLSTSRSTSSETSFRGSKATYVQLHELNNAEKTQKFFSYSLERILTGLGVKLSTADTREQWKLLQEHLTKYHSYPLPPLDEGNLSNSGQVLFSIFNKPLIKGKQIFTRFTLSDYISNASEFQWSKSEVGFPFTRHVEQVKIDLSAVKTILKQCPDAQALPQNPNDIGLIDQKIQSYALLNDERDAAAATLLAIPNIDEYTFLHEIGCWNGQNLMNLLFYASLKGRTPKYCLGTDINNAALSMGESLSHFLNLEAPFIQFYHANALDSFNPECLHLKFQNELKLALRVIPVLPPSQALTFLQNVRRSFQTGRSAAIVSYATPHGRMYDQNLSRSQGHTDKDFPGATTFQSKFLFPNLLPKYLQGQQDNHVVLNTYYTDTGFSHLMQKGGFKIEHTISIEHDTDNQRVVALIVPTGLNCL